MIELDREKGSRLLSALLDYYGDSLSHKKSSKNTQRQLIDIIFDRYNTVILVNKTCRFLCNNREYFYKWINKKNKGKLNPFI